MKQINTATIEFLSRSANEGFARTAAACSSPSHAPVMADATAATPSP